MSGSRGWSTSTRSSTSINRQSGAPRGRTRPPNGRVRPDPRAVLEPASPRTRLPPGPVLVQCEGRPVRELQGRRDHHHRDALPARCLCALRGLRGSALQPGDLTVRYGGRDIANILELSVSDAVTAFAAVPRIHRRLQTLEDVGARLHPPRPARHHALWRRGTADQAGRRVVPGRHRAARSMSSMSPRPGSTWRTSSA